MNWLLLTNSLAVSTATMLSAVFFGFSTALWVFCLEQRWRNMVISLSVVAFALPPFLVTNCWLHLLGNAGVLSSWLPFNVVSLGGTVWILTLLTWPVAFFFALSALRRIEKSYFEAEPMLRGRTLLTSLVLPMSRKELSQAAALTFILALNNFVVPVILQTKIFPEEVWLSFNTDFNYAAAVKFSAPLVIVPLLVLSAFRSRDIRWPNAGEAVSCGLFRAQLGTLWFVCGAVIGVSVLTFSVAVPLLQILSARQTWSDLIPAVAAGQNAIAASLLLAVAAAFGVSAIAIASWKSSLVSIGWLTFLIPGMLLGIAFVWIFNRPGFALLYPTTPMVILAFVIRYFAPGSAAVTHALKSTDRVLNDAAEVEGANSWQLFKYVQWPQVGRQICVAWYIVYIFCLWDVETLVFIVPPGVETISLRIFNLLHYGHNSQVNALCLSLVFLAVVPLILWFTIHWIKAWRATTVCLFAGASLLVLSGCSVSKGDAVDNRFAVRSAIFDRVEIIGSRGTAPGQFNKPRSLALDSNDNLFVVDMTGRVQKFSSAGVYLSSWQMPQTDLGKPKGMSRDNDGHIIVVEPHYQRLNHFSSDGKLIAQWGQKGTNVGDLVLPRSVAVNSHGDIIVSEYTTVDRVQRFSAYGKKWLGSFGYSGQGAGEFNRPEGLGIDAHDRIYVADSCNHRIEIFSPEGEFLKAYGTAGTASGELSYPYDVRVDAAGLQYVCEFGNSRIQIFDVNNHALEILGKAGGNPGEFANPWSIALDSKGNLYVADSQNHRVQKFIRKTHTAATIPTAGSAHHGST